MIDSKKRPHSSLKPSPWVTRFIPLIPHGGEILDLACGSGRHTRYLLDSGHKVTALDKDVSKVIMLTSNSNFSLFQWDLETIDPWPFPDKSFSGIVVTNYLYRPLFQNLINALDDNGILIYETFSIGNEHYGHPKNPDFLLNNEELFELCKNELTVVAFEQGIVLRQTAPKVIQRVCAQKNSGLDPIEIPVNLAQTSGH